MAKFKYKNQPVEEDGYRFASKREHKRYCQLKLLEMGHEIESLELQPRFPIAIGMVKICTYIGDFRYRDRRTGDLIVEDVKGVRTREYIIKKKLVKACYGIEIVEV
jgi:hypothetical protein